MKMDYVINPVKMGGLVKEVSGERIKVHLHGRLIISEVPIEAGHEMEFYFSYIQVVEKPYDYDASDMTPDHEPEPCLLGGKITEVNDTAIEVAVMNNLGSVAVPRRWVFTPIVLEKGQDVEFYFSCMKVIGKRDIPAEMI